MKKVIFILSVFLLLSLINFSSPVFLSPVFAVDELVGDCIIYYGYKGEQAQSREINGITRSYCDTVTQKLFDDLSASPNREGRDPFVSNYWDQTSVSGCTNPEATNYNEDATVDDGSCEVPEEDEEEEDDPEPPTVDPEPTTVDPEPTSGTQTSGGRTVAGSNIPLSNPITGKSGKPDVAKYIKGVIDVSLGLVGVLALTSFIYGGVLWMVSMGNSSLVEKGKKVMIWSTIGLLIVFSSYGILKIIFELFGYK